MLTILQFLTAFYPDPSVEFLTPNPSPRGEGLKRLPSSPALLGAGDKRG